MKAQVEDRLLFLTNGGEAKKNIDAMTEVLDELKLENLYIESEEAADAAKTSKKDKKQKKDKKNKKGVASVDAAELEEEIQ